MKYYRKLMLLMLIILLLVPLIGCFYISNLANTSIQPATDNTNTTNKETTTKSEGGSSETSDETMTSVNESITNETNQAEN